MTELPKELYLFVGTILGALVSLVTAMLTTRGQLRLARENHEFQPRMEEQKFAAQQEKEHREQLRKKLEEAHQLLTKISMYTTPQASHKARHDLLAHRRFW
jgi:hypothetical protein